MALHQAIVLRARQMGVKSWQKLKREIPTQGKGGTRWAPSPVGAHNSTYRLIGVISPQLPMYNAIYSGHISIYNDRSGPPCTLQGSDMTSWKITIANRDTHIHVCFSIVMLVFGGVPSRELRHLPFKGTFESMSFLF